MRSKKRLSTAAFAILIFFLSFGASGLSAGGGGKFDFQSVLVHHLMDAVVIEWNIGGEKVYEGQPGFDKAAPFGMSGLKSYKFRDAKGVYKWNGGIPMHLTKRVTMMFVVVFFMLVIFIGAARMIAANPYRVRGKFTGIVESLVLFIRNDVVGSNMHGHGKGFEPYILSLFFFILFSNLFGLVPPLGEIVHTAQVLASGKEFSHGQPGDTVNAVVGVWPGITVTGDIAVTASLAIITTLMIWITGFRYQGVSFLWSFLPKGLPILLVPVLFILLFILELVIGPLAKGFALTMRLLANMTGGHVIILALLGFIFQFQSYAVVPVSVVGAGAIYLLEIFVGFLQAFIFAMLTTMFIGDTMHAH